MGRRRAGGKRMDSGGRSERKRVGSDGDAPVILAAHIMGMRMRLLPSREAKLSGTADIPPQRAMHGALGRFLSPERLPEKRKHENTY